MEKRAIRQLRYVSDFRCDSSKCRQNCCQIYSIWIEDYDYELLQSKAPEFAKVVTCKNNRYLIPSDESSCVFLMDGLCSVHAEYGEFAIPEVCYTYPRLYFEFDGMAYVSSNLLCDYMIKLIYSIDNPFDIVDGVSCRIPKYIEEQKEFTASNFKDLYKNNLINLYQEIIKLIDNPELTSNQMVYALIDLADQLDKKPRAEWLEIIRSYISDFNAQDQYKPVDDKQYKDLFRKISAIFLEISVKEGGKKTEVLINNLRAQFDNTENLLTPEKDNILKTYLKIKLTENFFPVNAWYSCLAEISMLVSGYILLKEAIKSLNSPSVEDIAEIITSIEPILLINRKDVFYKYYERKIIDKSALQKACH